MFADTPPPAESSCYHDFSAEPAFDAQAAADAAKHDVVSTFEEQPFPAYRFRRAAWRRHASVADTKPHTFAARPFRFSERPVAFS